MREEEEFKWRLDEENAPSPPPRPPSRRGAAQKRRPRAKGEYFARAWLWHLRLLREKRAGGRVLRFYHLLLEEDFNSFGKPFAVTTQMMEAAGVDRHRKADLLDALEQWGIVFLERRGHKNPLVSLRQREGRGQNPFTV